MTSVYFNRPARSLDLTELIRDVRGASDRLAVASAWFTNREVARAIIDSPSPLKLVYLNASDLRRGGSSPVYEMLKTGVNARLADPSPAQIEAQRRWGVGEQGVFVLGSGDWTEGVMHHKFVIADAVVWAGSYNLTYHAAHNYEYLLRLTEYAVVDSFWQECLALQQEWPLWMGTDQNAWANGAFRCDECMRLYPLSALGADHDSHATCKACLRGAR
jgi:phosphatidylserine/phosphatidylglycerophosphate/cardiolipin synthase-like enzyme